MNNRDAARLYACLWALLDASQEINRVMCVVKDTDGSIYDVIDEVHPEQIDAFMRVLKIQGNNLIKLAENAQEIIRDKPTDPEREDEINTTIANHCEQYINSGETIIDKMLKKIGCE